MTGGDCPQHMHTDWAMNMSFRTVLVLAALLAGCTREDQTANAQRSNLSETEVRRLATEFMRTWVAEHPSEAEKVGRATIRSLQRTDKGWHVVCEQIRLPGEPEGESHHFLHIYLDSKGTLEKIERGPDVIT